MKTASEAAAEYAAHIGAAQAGEAIAQAFLAGAAFAQQWVAVEDELPDVGVFVCIKFFKVGAGKEKGKKAYHWMTRRMANTTINVGGWHWELMTSAYEVTHWKPFVE